MAEPKLDTISTQYDSRLSVRSVILAVERDMKLKLWMNKAVTLSRTEGRRPMH